MLELGWNVADDVDAKLASTKNVTPSQLHLPIISALIYQFMNSIQTLQKILIKIDDSFLSLFPLNN